MFQGQIDENAAAAAQTAREALPSGDFPPLPGGPYQAIVVANKGVEPFTKDPNNANYGKDVVRLQVQIDDNSPTGAKRTEFVRVPLFSRFAPNPNAKTDEGKTIGSSARMFWNFFEDVMGMTTEQIISGQLRSDVEGKALTIVLSKPKQPDNYNPLGFNDIDGVGAPHGNFDKTPIVPPGHAAAPWLTPDNQLIPDHSSLQQRGGAAGGGYTPGGGGAATGGYQPGGAPAAGGYVPGGGAAPQQAQVQQQPQQQYAPAAAQPQYAPQQAAQQQYVTPAQPTFPGQVVPGAPAQQPQQGFAPGGGFQPPQQVNIPDGVPPEWAGAQAGTAAGTGYGL